MKIPDYDYLWQYLEHWCAVDPSFPALRYKGQTYTYHDFNVMTNKLAMALLELGVVRGDRILTILPMQPEYVFTYIAGLKIGAIVTPMDVRFRASDLRRFISHTTPKVIVSLDQHQNFNYVTFLGEISLSNPKMKIITLEGGIFGEPFNTFLNKALPMEEELKAVKAYNNINDGALIIFTGGTTGVPKSALLSHLNITTTSKIMADYIQRWYGAEKEILRSKFLVNFPPSHVGGTVEIFGTPLVMGQEMILMDRWHPYEVLKITDEEKIPLVGAVPTMYAILLDLPDLERFDLSGVKVALMSGEKVSLELLEGVRKRICSNVINGYGSTEAGSEVTFTELDDDLVKIAQGYVGKALPGVELKVVDEKGKELPPYKQGEILVRGPLTIKSYFNMPEEDRVGFTVDGFCYTGDTGYLSDEGGLYVQGRVKNIIRVGSYTVLPSEVEDVVMKDPNVSIAVAVGVPDRIYNEVVWLVVQAEHGKTVNTEKLIRLCQDELADFKVPCKVLVRDKLPTTRIGKVDRVLLQKELILELK